MTPDEFVLDASAVAKLFREEAETETFRTWYLERQKDGSRFQSPSLLPYELGEIIRGKERKTVEEQTAILRLALTGIELDTDAAPDAFRYSRGLTFYDASYLSLTKRLGGVLVTYDKRMQDAASELGCKFVGPGQKKK